MNWKERIELIIHCMNKFPQTTSQFAENYSVYIRLLCIWNIRYRKEC